MPSIMNLFGVLKYKKMGEDFVRNSGLPYTIIRFDIVSNWMPFFLFNFSVIKIYFHISLSLSLCRPGRLTDGPYTSYDLNTLLQATAGERRAVVIGQGAECFHIDGYSFALISLAMTVALL